MKISEEIRDIPEVLFNSISYLLKPLKGVFELMAMLWVFLFFGAVYIALVYIFMGFPLKVIAILILLFVMFK